MREQFPPVTINFGAVRVAGVPGLSLIAIVIAIAFEFEFPEARWLLALGLAAGADVVITDNRRHFLSALRYGLRVETPGEFVAASKKKPRP